MEAFKRLPVHEWPRRTVVITIGMLIPSEDCVDVYRRRLMRWGWLKRRHPAPTMCTNKYGGLHPKLSTTRNAIIWFSRRMKPVGGAGRRLISTSLSTARDAGFLLIYTVSLGGLFFQPTVKHIAVGRMISSWKKSGWRMAETVWLKGVSPSWSIAEQWVSTRRCICWK
jgi:hypothetical protein